jgi:hypothetical protein
MTGGDRVSARERGRARARAGHADGPRCWAVRLGRAGGRKEKAARVKFLFLFFKNVNSASICFSKISENFCVSFSRCKLLRKNIKC